MVESMLKAMSVPYECTNTATETSTPSVVELILDGSNPQADIDTNAPAVSTGVTSCNTPPIVVMTTDTIDHSENDTTTSTTNGALLKSDGVHSEQLQADISRWEMFYDQMYEYLQTKTLPKKNPTGIAKAASSYNLGSDNKLYYSKPSKDGTSVSTVLVVRGYDERVKICNEIHVMTGSDNFHHRRDKMLELIGQQYFWKGQRKDICECIASCDICSHGYGCRRKTKPPGQARDIRIPGKIRTPSSSPLGTHKSVASSVPTMQHTQKRSPKRRLPQISLETLSKRSKLLSDSPLASSSSSTSKRRATSTGIQSGLFELHTPVEVCSQSRPPEGAAGDTNLTSSSSSCLANSFQQIFTTIIEPAVTSGAASPENSADENDFSQETSTNDQGDKEEEEERSVYDLLFGLDSQPCDTILPSVIQAMQSALKETVNPVALTKSCESHMIQALSLPPDDYTIIIAPSRAAAYIIAVSASMLKIDPLSINRRINSRQGLPLAVLHDACCHGNQDSGPLKTCTALTGAYDWELGDLASPMDRRMLSMAIRSNRVAAVCYQPYSYMKHCQHMSLQEVCSSCHTLVNDVTVIVDGSGMKRGSRRGFVFTMMEFFAQGADIVLLPDTEILQGPPSTCAMIGRVSLLKQVSQNISLLQSQIALPLTCASHDLVGTVVAYKTFELTS